jgi:hypothetical protein
MRLLKFLIEEIILKKKTWQVVDLNDLSEKMRNILWDMYVDTYQGIGLHIESPKKLTTKYKVSWLIDIDDDAQPDAFIIYKDLGKIKKIALMGSDGSKLAKSNLIKKIIFLLKSKNWIIEASHKLSDIIESNNVNIIEDIEKIKEIIGEDKFVEDLKGGLYKRKLGSLGVVKKKLYGNI